MLEFAINRLTPGDRDWVRMRIIELWGAEIVVAHGITYYPAELPGFTAMLSNTVVGLLTYHIEGKNCEIVTIDSWSEGHGVGTALIEAVKLAAQQEGCQRLWLVTTNDNLNALHFYQKRGFVFAAVRINALEKSRLLKPEIPLTGQDGIPLRDEIEMEMLLNTFANYVETEGSKVG